MSVEIKILDVSILFPFKPYDCQIDYMTKVIGALQNKKNALLESPTGTGKTLSLLCSSLAWQEAYSAFYQSQIQQNEILGTMDGKLSDAVQDFHKTLLKSSGSQSINGSLSEVPKIIFASRTHSQLSQAMHELKRTAYKTRKAGIIGSRDQLCINADVQRAENHQVKLHMCRAKVQTRTCEFYNRFEQLKPESAGQMTAPSSVAFKLSREAAGCGNAAILDIEELVSVGQRQRFCPYYMARELKQDADVIFMPYNYLLDPKIRRLHNIELKGNVIIFDEAHNVEKVCEESSSVEINSVDIARAVEELAEVLRRLISDAEDADEHLLNESDYTSSSNTADGRAVSAMELAAQLEFDAGQVKRLHDQLRSFEAAVEGLPLTRRAGGLGKQEVASYLKSGDHIFQILGDCGFTFSTCRWILSLLEKVIRFTSDLSGGNSLKRSSNSTLWRGGSGSGSAGLTKILELFSSVFAAAPLVDSKGFAQDLTEEYVQSIAQSARRSAAREFKLYVREENRYQASTAKDSSNNAWDAPRVAESTSGPTALRQRVLSYWCFSASLALRDLLAEEPRSVLLTSGTLYPFECYRDNLGLVFDFQLQNSHVINADQMWVGVFSKGPDSVRLNSSYEFRESREYQASLGQTIANLARIVPHGMLVFFPSYSLMSKCVEQWQGCDIYHRIVNQKPLLQEPRKKTDFQSTIELYNGMICDPSGRGALLMAVCRGKVSEGLDFADHFGRAVLITGLPFPPFLDARVQMKMEHLDERRVSDPRASGGLTGRQWYRQEAWRAVNQAVGRVIRHKNDYGAILLCDERFGGSEAANQLPAWLRSQLKAPDNFGTALRELSVFYRVTAERYPKPGGVTPRPSHQQRSHDDLLSKSSGNLISFDFAASGDSTAQMRHHRVAPSSRATMPASQLEFHLPGLRARKREERIAAAQEAETAALLSYSAPLVSLLGDADGVTAAVDDKNRRRLPSLQPNDSALQRSSSNLLLNSDKFNTSTDFEETDRRLVRRLRADACAASKRIRLSCSSFLSLNLDATSDSTTLTNSSLSSTNHSPSDRFADFHTSLSKSQLALCKATLQKYKSQERLSQCILDELVASCLPHAPHLIKNIYGFIRKDDKQRFYTFFQAKIPGLLVDDNVSISNNDLQDESENRAVDVTTVICAVCNESGSNPAVSILYVRSCRHRACFQCWRKIIDDGDRRCPTCQQVIRRRDLVRVIRNHETSVSTK